MSKKDTPSILVLVFAAVLFILNVLKRVSKSCHVNFSKSVLNTVPADGLAPCGARTSAGSVMSMFGFRLYS